MTGSEGDAPTTRRGEPLAVQTFVARVLRSAALRADAELEIVLDTAIVRVRADGSNYVNDLWHRVREEIAEERHEQDSRLPDAAGGDFIELTQARLSPLTAPDREVQFGDLVVFTRDIRAIRSSRRPDHLTSSPKPAGAPLRSPPP